MNTDIPAFSNAATKIRLRFVDSDRGPVSLPVELYVGSGESRISIAPDAYDSSLLVVPPLSSGIYSYTLLLGGHPVLKGNIRVAPSNLPEGNIDHHVLATVALPHIFLYTSTGPQGEKGERGFSSYEIAVQHGYQGTEDEWVAELSGAQAAANEAKTQATSAAASATAAGESATQATTQAGNAAASATAAGESATQAATQAGNAAASATAAGESATQAATQAGNAAASATAAGESVTQAAASATTARKQATAADSSAKSAEGSATTAGEQATAASNSASAAASSAKEAAASAADAESTLAAAAKLADNNTYSGVNTFNGEVVSNGSLHYRQQELGDLLSYQVAARLLDAGINPVSAMARTWDEWVAMNPNWKSFDSLFFYAPLIQDSIPALNTATSVSRCTYISSAVTNSTGCQYLLGRKFNIFTLATQGQDAAHCYNGLQCYYCAPRVTRLVSSLNAFALSSPANTAELSVFTPELTAIEQSVETNIGNTFRRLGTLKTFSIYAPKLVTSFRFSDAAASKAQYCSVLQSLVAGIGTPETEQTITTRTPIDNADENISALQTAAADKNWKFNFV